MGLGVLDSWDRKWMVRCCKLKRRYKYRIEDLPLLDLRSFLAQLIKLLQRIVFWVRFRALSSFFKFFLQDLKRYL